MNNFTERMNNEPPRREGHWFSVDSWVQDAVTAAANTHEAQLRNMLPLMFQYGCGVKVWRWYEDEGDHHLVAHQEMRIDLETPPLTVGWMPFGQRPPS